MSAGSRDTAIFPLKRCGGMSRASFPSGCSTINADTPTQWKADIAASVDHYNAWFMKFAPRTYREKRVEVTGHVEGALVQSEDLTDVSTAALRNNPSMLPVLRTCCCPPLARERLAGLAGVKKTLIEKLEAGSLPSRIKAAVLESSLGQVVRVLSELLDTELFPWLGRGGRPGKEERHRASTIVADRLCGSMSDPIIRNAQEKRQLDLVAAYLRKNGYRRKPHPTNKPLTEMESGTFAFRMNVLTGGARRIKIPIDVVIQPKQPRPSGLPILIEAKSAGDFTNVNKRRKEEAKKMAQLKAQLGNQVEFVLFLCGYFNAGYLGYEAAEGMDWIWEHRIEDLDKLGP
jgi:hypothetical protein